MILTIAYYILIDNQTNKPEKDIIESSSQITNLMSQIRIIKV